MTEFLTLAALITFAGTGVGLIVAAVVHVALASDPHRAGGARTRAAAASGTPGCHARPLAVKAGPAMSSGTVEPIPG